MSRERALAHLSKWGREKEVIGVAGEECRMPVNIHGGSSGADETDHVYAGLSRFGGI